mmetsp:Transcript_45218/g.96158  ORF Transcript_45218/g.96158 Transcript_45218/m.96158 type:complete len:248 (-) Transcript_45218:97-840(-)
MTEASRMGISPYPVHSSSWLSGTRRSSEMSAGAASSERRTAAQKTTSHPAMECSRQTRSISNASSVVYASSGPKGATRQPRLSSAKGHRRWQSGMNWCAGTAAPRRREFGPGITSALSQTACPLALSSCALSASSNRQGSTALATLKSSLRWRLPSTMQQSRKCSKVRSDERAGGCAMIGPVALMIMSASMALIFSLESVFSSFAREQQECIHTRSAALGCCDGLRSSAGSSSGCRALGTMESIDSP